MNTVQLRTNVFHTSVPFIQTFQIEQGCDNGDKLQGPGFESRDLGLFINKREIQNRKPTLVQFLTSGKYYRLPGNEMFSFVFIFCKGKNIAYNIFLRCEVTFWVLFSIITCLVVRRFACVTVNQRMSGNSLFYAFHCVWHEYDTMFARFQFGNKHAGKHELHVTSRPKWQGQMKYKTKLH